MTESQPSLVLDLLDPWLRRQRWFPVKDDPAASLSIADSIDLPDPSGQVACTIVLVRVVSKQARPILLQVPLVVADEEGVDGRGRIATVDDGVLLDGPYHPGFARAWLAAATVTASAPELLTRLAPDTARVHAGEQSNTSVRLDGSAGGAMLKVFRVLDAGANPDVEVPAALREAHWGHVPQVLAALAGSWPLPEGTGRATGDLGVLTALVPRARDGFELACEYARLGRDFTPEATRLGECVAQLHAHLARAFGRPPAGSPQWKRRLHDRAGWAEGEVPALQAWSAQIAQVIDSVDTAALPAPQRIHGDLHLGQLLHAQDWFVLDFEGEPLEPLSRRRAPDQPLRDVAGMLRSIDYAAAVGGAASPAWREEARGAFLNGYRAIQTHVDQTVLHALELDKALYETVYETRHRPDWLPIPLGAIRRLIEEETVAQTQQPAGPTPAPAPQDVLAALAEGSYYAPHDYLGPHLDTETGVLTIRVIAHLASGVSVHTLENAYPATHEYGGIWVVAFAAEEVPDYRLQMQYGRHNIDADDPYRFLPSLGELDQHLVAEGRHEQLWEVLGARVRHYPTPLGVVTGTSFAVWAPNARAVRVVGDFNGWDGRGTAMRSLGATGVWEVFLPGVGPGAKYKYEIRFADGSWHMKADPMARATEVPPATASVVTESEYRWADQDWMTRRAQHDPHQGPMSVYEVHLASWRQGRSYRQLATELVEYVSWMGFTHVEFLPVAEHPFGGSWGYQVTSYYAPTARLGTPDDFRYLVDRLHRAGIGVLVDWVPAHFPKDAWALARFDGTALYEDPDPLRGEQQDWGTYVFNFGRNEVRNFLVANALYWLTEFHIDGLRVDAVASMLYLDYSREAGQWRPNIHGGRENLEAIGFLQEANATAYRLAPGTMMIAEESTAWPGVTTPTSDGGLGFGLKWNMGWMNDTLQYMAEEPINRRYHHGELTFSLVYAFSEQFVLPLSHDEVVHGKGSLWEKMPGDLWAKLAGVRLLLAYQWTHPGKNLLFMGGEFAQNTEWSEAHSLNWELSDTPSHAGVREMLRQLNQVYRDYPALWAQDFTPDGFEWVEANDGDHNVLAYLRKSSTSSSGTDTAENSEAGAGADLLVVANFAGTPHEGYRVGVSGPGAWQELLNTDDTAFGGSGVVNTGQLRPEQLGWHGRSHSMQLRVPPLGVTLLRRV